MSAPPADRPDPGSSSPSIADSARVHDSATIGPNTRIGQYAVIEEDVQIGAGCALGHHVVVHAGSRIGDRVRVDDHADVGKQPMRAVRSATTEEDRQPPTVVETDCLIGTGAILYANCRLARGVMVADQATVREDVRIGEETIVGRGVAIENQCRIGARCKVETNAYVTAYSRIGDDAFLAPGVLTSNDAYLGRTEKRFDEYAGVTIERGGRIGVGAVVLPGRTVEADAVVGAGAVLTDDAAAETVWVGVPARRHGEVPDEQLLDNQ